MHILPVKDDPVVADVLAMTNEEAGHFPSIAHKIEVALVELRHDSNDAGLLDINLPNRGRPRLARLICKNHLPVPILVVSNNACIDDKINGLDTCANAYLSKPFEGFELLTHLDANVRRTHGHNLATIAVSNLDVDLNRHLALINSAQVPPIDREFRIVKFLALRKGIVLNKTTFQSDFYVGLDEPEPKIIDVFTCKLCRKLELAGAARVNIDTFWG